MGDNSKLIFWRPADGNGRLVFGDAADAAAAPDAVFSADAELPGLDVGGPLRYAARLSSAADLPGLEVAGALAWDANVARPLMGQANSRYQRARGIAAGARSRWQHSERVAASVSARWQIAVGLAAPVMARWQQSQALRSAASARYQHALGLLAQAGSRYQYAAALRAFAIGRYQHAQPIAAQARSSYQHMLQLRPAARGRYQMAQPIASPASGRFRGAVPVGIGVRNRYQIAWWPQAGMHRPQLPPGVDPRDPCYDPATLSRLIFEDAWVNDGRLVFLCIGHGVQPPGAIVVPVRRAYIVINDIELRRVDGNLPLPAYTLAMSLDADSWTWQWSATLHKAALPLLAPARSGEPVEVEVKVNGVPYRLLVESMRRGRQFAQTRIEVSGRGIAALLDAPYAATQQFGNPSGPRSAQQLMLDVLTINGVSIGWAVDWGLTDWQVPAGTWSHQGSYITALNAIAQAAGGYLQPHATARTLRVLPRYPVAPWEWGTLAPDIELPMDPVSIEGVEWVKKPDYTRVYVSGEGATGVLARITRTGTAGDELAPMVTDALITHADAARQRGRAILSDTGAQAMVSLTLPVLPETGLVLPGQFIRRTDGAEVLQGYVRGMSLVWDRPKMRQTLEVQTHG